MTPRIVKLAGTNGSGKSTVAHTLLGMCGHQVLLREGHKTRLTLLELPGGSQLVLVGSYLTQCGGCDGIQPYSDNLRLLSLAVELAPSAHVLMEGLLIAGMGSLGTHMLGFASHEAVFATMDTPLSTCIERVNKRRAVKGKEPLENTDNINAKWSATQRSHQSLTEAGHRTALVSHKRPVREVLALFGVSLAREPRHG